MGTGGRDDPYTGTLNEIESASAGLAAGIVRARHSRGKSRKRSLIRLHTLVRTMGLELNFALGGWPETAEEPDQSLSDGQRCRVQPQPPRQQPT